MLRRKEAHEPEAPWTGQQYEYRTAGANNLDELNRLGAQGWKAVCPAGNARISVLLLIRERVSAAPA